MYMTRFLLPEIPDSSKWSSNKKFSDPIVIMDKPEIPDSSKWSSNIEKHTKVQIAVYLKYQIPVSGVQTFVSVNLSAYSLT